MAGRVYELQFTSRGDRLVEAHGIRVEFVEHDVLRLQVFFGERGALEVSFHF